MVPGSSGIDDRGMSLIHARSVTKTYRTGDVCVPALRGVDLDIAAGESRFAAADGSEAVLLVGPEGGWTEAERSDLAAAGALPFSLGPRVLRVETAAVVGAALALCR